MSELPSGTVTFLFTDIEGSTALWERDRQAMAAAVQRHIVLLDTAIHAHGGAHFKTVGDAVQAAFPTASDAVAAAVAGQRALLAEDWGEVGPLKVRMALHAGEALPDDRGDYLAAPLNRLSRLLASGYGGQVLLSQTMQQLTRGTLPSGTKLRDLGDHRLRDLLEPERVFQLLHPDLPEQFPPLKTLESRPNNLPLQPTLFLGREREVEQVAALLRRPEVRFLTLTGPGGTGKSRLALQAAAELLVDFPDGVFFVPLAPLTDPDLVLSTIAITLGIREGVQALAERLRDFLATKQLLLVLDNFEHLVSSAPAVGQLLGVCPGLKVVATSRMPLRLRAEREYAVPPLGLPHRKPPPTLEQLSQFEAVRLFIERAQGVKADFAIDNENAPVVAEICWRLDGLPLAIELAATRVRMLPPQAMLDRLEQRLPMLTGGARDAPERQRTLRNTIAWSYDLLESEDQALFRHVAVFAGGCTFAAMETVANAAGSRDVFGGLERLLEQSLLRQEQGQDGEPRFSMLETIREFALEQLSRNPGEDSAVRRTHATFFADLVNDLHSDLGKAQPNAVGRITAEQDNIRAMLAWLLDTGEQDLALRTTAILSDYWTFVGGQFNEGRSWLDRALALPGDPPPAARSFALGGAAAMDLNRGELETARLLAMEALAFARISNDPTLIIGALTMQGWSNTGLGRPEEAVPSAIEALRMARETADPVWLPWTLSSLGAALLRIGDLVEARTMLEEALDVSRQFGARWCEVDTMLHLGMVLVDQGELGNAATMIADSLVTRLSLGGGAHVGTSLLALAEIANKAGQPDTGAVLQGAAEAQYGLAGMDPQDTWRVFRGPSIVSELKQQLGSEGFTTSFTRGREMSTDEASACAIAVSAAIQAKEAYVATCQAAYEQGLTG